MSVDLVQAAVTATRVGTARYTHLHRVNLGPVREYARRTQARHRPQSDGTLQGDVRRLRHELLQAGIRRVGREVFEHIGGVIENETTGVIDFAGRRYLAESHSGTHLVGPDGEHDASGDDWKPPDLDRPDADSSMLWLVDVLSGAITADEHGSEDLRGTACRVFDVGCDLRLAKRATPGRLPTPEVLRFDALLAFPLRVWIGADLVRRVVSVDDASARSRTLELFDHGAPIDPEVWTRPPRPPASD